MKQRELIETFYSSNTAWFIPATVVDILSVCSSFLQWYKDLLTSAFNRSTFAITNQSPTLRADYFLSAKSFSKITLLKLDSKQQVLLRNSSLRFDDF